MIRYALIALVAGSLFAPVLVTAGCGEEVSKQQSVTHNPDGTSSTDTKTVTRNPDGSVTNTDNQQRNP